MGRAVTRRTTAGYRRSVLDREDLLKHDDFDPDDVTVVTARTEPTLVIVDPDPGWPADFERLRSRLQDALGVRALSIEHVGSTSVPGMAAKAVIDVDLVVADSAREDAYVDDLVRAGFPFLFREPGWHQHRMFGSENPYGNIHVFGPDSPELVRHVVFRDWLRTHPADRDAYVTAKRDAAAAATSGEASAAGLTSATEPAGRLYNQRKQAVIRDILERAFAAR